MIRALLLLCIQLLLSNLSFGQAVVDLDKFDVSRNEKLIAKSDFINHYKSFSESQLHEFSFLPKTDGPKTFYYLNGGIYGQGEMKNKKENGSWTYWHENGKKAREGVFNQGVREGTHTYWYSNGNLRGTGGFKNDKADGEWIMYSEDGTEKVEQLYKEGELVKD